MTGAETIHGTCVAFGDIGVLLRGPSGLGKSDLALRLIEAGATLVADDRVMLSAVDGRLVAHPPPALAGLLEVRGIGLVELPYASDIGVALIVDLVPPEVVDRLPDPGWSAYLDRRIRTIALVPFEHTTVAKLRIAAYDAAAQPDPVTGARRPVENDRHDDGQL
jgi:serine kinase of HPr protein (carbohydrate metabolism regulator)